MSPKSASRRLDVVVAEQSAISRERARALIMAGKVRVNGTPSLKAGAAEGRNTMPLLIDCVRAYATLGEMCDALREVYGEYQEPVF